MKRERYSEGQIIAILKEHETGASVPDLACRHGVDRTPEPEHVGMWEI